MLFADGISCETEISSDLILHFHESRSKVCTIRPHGHLSKRQRWDAAKRRRNFQSVHGGLNHDPSGKTFIIQQSKNPILRDRIVSDFP